LFFFIYLKEQPIQVWDWIRHRERDGRREERRGEKEKVREEGV